MYTLCGKNIYIHNMYSDNRAILANTGLYFVFPSLSLLCSSIDMQKDFSYLKSKVGPGFGCHM